MKHLFKAIPLVAIAACAPANSLPPAQAPIADACNGAETRALTPTDLTAEAFVLVEPTADFRAFGQGARENDVVEIILTRTNDQIAFRVNCAVSIDGRTYFYATIPAGQYRLGALERRRGGQIVRLASGAAKPFALTPGTSYLGSPSWVIKADRKSVSFVPAADTADAAKTIARIAPGLASAMRDETMK